MSSNEERAKEYDIESLRWTQKFDYFVVWLCFALAALAAETAQRQPYIFLNVAEVLGWILIVSCGLLGLSRLEWQPNIMKSNAFHFAIKASKQNLQDGQARGVVFLDINTREPLDINAILAAEDSKLALVQGNLVELGEKLGWRYQAMRYLFLAGLLLLAAARASVLLIPEASAKCCIAWP
jgi:hypothetical protein